MHEAGIAQNIIDEVERIVREKAIAGRVTRIHLRVGKLASVVPENLTFLFETLSGGTSLEGASLSIDHVPVRGECRDCRAEFAIEDLVFTCPACASPRVSLLSGRELLIDSLEVA